MHKWNVYPDFDAVSIAAAEFLATNIEKSIKQRGCCHVALPGGNSPGLCLSLLASKKLNWQKVNWYVGDERCYPQGHAERNDTMLNEVLWAKLAQPNIFPIPTELGAEAAAAAYRDVIKPIDSFDIIFLGMGEDGHTASLFPDNEALQDKRSVVPVFNSPKPPSDRVSLSINTIKNARCRMVLTTGATKSPVIASIKAGVQLPINQVGDIIWFVDELAVQNF